MYGGFDVQLTCKHVDLYRLLDRGRRGWLC